MIWDLTAGRRPGHAASMQRMKEDIMKFVYLIMGRYDTRRDRAAIQDGGTRIIGVSDIDEACMVAKELCDEGVDCIEVCGAFGEAGARKVIAATENRVPVGYVVHLPEQDGLFDALFG